MYVQQESGHDDVAGLASQDASLVEPSSGVRAWVRRFEAGDGDTRRREPHVLRVSVVLTGVLRTAGRAPRKLLTPGSMLIASGGSRADLEAIDDESGSALTFEFDEGRGARSSHDRCLAASKAHVALAERAIAWAARPSDDALERLAHDVRDAALAGTEVSPDACGASDRLEPRIARALRVIEEHHDDDCSLQVLADEAGLGVFHFLRSFKRCVGQTPCQHVMAVRLRAAARLLSASNARVVDIAIEAGFNDLSHFNATFRDVFGMQPSAYRRAPNG